MVLLLFQAWRLHFFSVVYQMQANSSEGFLILFIQWWCLRSTGSKDLTMSLNDNNSELPKAALARVDLFKQAKNLFWRKKKLVLIEKQVICRFGLIFSPTANLFSLRLCFRKCQRMFWRRLKVMSTTGNLHSRPNSHFTKCLSVVKYDSRGRCGRKHQPQKFKWSLARTRRSFHLSQLLCLVI